MDNDISAPIMITDSLPLRFHLIDSRGGIYHTIGVYLQRPHCYTYLQTATT